MRKINQLFFISLLSFLFISCDNKSVKVISIDMGNMQHISELNDYFRTISLDTLEIALLGEVSSMIFLNNQIAIQTPNRLSLFDNSGNYLYDIGRRGQANDEFISLNNAFYKNNAFELFDGDRQRVLRFAVDGTFVNYKDFDESIGYGVNRLTPFLDGYAAMLRYRGGFIQTPTFGRFDKDLAFKETAGKNRISGLSLFQTFSLYQNKLLHWNMFDYTIYSIDENFTVQEEYIINFGRYSIPNRIIQSNNAERIMEYVQENFTNVVIAIQHVVEQESFLSFLFNIGDDLYLAVYNKEENSTRIHSLASSEELNFYPFMAIHDSYYVFCGVDPQNRYSNLEIIFVKQCLLQ